MKKETGTFYGCEHCKKISRQAGAISLHEKTCKNNPVFKVACIGCQFLEVDNEESVFGSYEDNVPFGAITTIERPTRTWKTFKCLKLNQEMYPHKVERKIKKYPESFEDKVKMPTTCEHYEVETFDDGDFF